MTVFRLKYAQFGKKGSFPELTRIWHKMSLFFQNLTIFCQISEKSRKIDKNANCRIRIFGRKTDIFGGPFLGLVFREIGQIRVNSGNDPFYPNCAYLGPKMTNFGILTKIDQISILRKICLKTTTGAFWRKIWFFLKKRTFWGVRFLGRFSEKNEFKAFRFFSQKRDFKNSRFLKAKRYRVFQQIKNEDDFWKSLFLIRGIMHHLQ